MMVLNTTPDLGIPARNKSPTIPFDLTMPEYESDHQLHEVPRPNLISLIAG